MDQLTADFNKEQSGKIHVEARAIDPMIYRDELREAIAADDVPDIFVCDLSEVGAYASAGLLLDLLPFLQVDEVEPEAVFFSNALQLCRHDTGLYALPFHAEVRLLFYNKGLLLDAGYDPERPPATWQELLEMARKLTKEDKKGFYDVLGFNIKSAASDYLMFAWGNDVELIQDGRLVLNSPEAVQALTEWRKVVDEFVYEKLIRFNSEFGTGPADPFNAGKLAMCIQSSEFIEQIEKYGYNIDFGMVPVPYPKRAASLAEGLSVTISAGSNAGSSAYMFARYLTGAETQLYLVENTDAVTLNRETARSERLSDNLRERALHDLMEIARFRPVVPELPKWNKFNEKAVLAVELGNQNPLEALDEAQDMIELNLSQTGEPEELWPAAEQLFRSAPSWLGGDGAFSVYLGDERTLWLFGDSFVSSTQSRSRRQCHIPRNTVAIQQGNDPSTASISFYWGEKHGGPASYFPEQDRDWFWPMHGIRVGDTLTLFLYHVRSDPNPFGFMVEKWLALRIDNPDDSPDLWTPEVLNTFEVDFNVCVGVSVIREEGWVYAYSIREPGNHEVYLLRWPEKLFERGELTCPQWWMGEERGWIEHAELDSIPEVLFVEGSTEFSVCRRKDGRGFVQVQSHGFGSSTLALRFADRPEGPWTAMKDVFTPPESQIPGAFVYAGKAHCHLSGADLIATYVPSSTDSMELYDDVSLYYPRFVRLSLETREPE